MSTAAERKFTNLRKRLDQLGYRQPLGVDSIPLVEKLFGDLLHTTESFKNAKTELNHRDVERVDWERIVEPYKRDNGRLTKENSDLHLQLIKIKEENEMTIRDLKATLRQHEHENADLRFLNSQYAHKIKSLEKEIKLKTDRIHQLQERNFQAVIETPGGRKRHIPQRRQRMDIDAAIAPSDNDINDYDNNRVTDPYVADLLRVADERIEKLQKQVDMLKDDNDSHERRIKSLRKQIDVRDKEIERLSTLLNEGRSIDAVIDETKKDSSERIISHLNVQVDFLQDANRELERKLEKMMSTKSRTEKDVKSLSKKNNELCEELKDIDRLSKQLEQEKDEALADSHRELADIQERLQNQVKLKEDLKDRSKVLQDHITSIDTENVRLAELLATSERESKKVAKLLDKLESENKELKDKCDKLSNSERELLYEIERQKQKSIAKNQSMTKVLEDERDYYRKECLTLQNLLKQREKLLPSSDDSKSNDSVSITVLERERDYYRQECNTLRDILNSESIGVSKSPAKEKSASKDRETIRRLRQERDELKNILEKFERNLTEIQGNVKDLAHDRDSAALLYKQVEQDAQEELQRLRHESTISPATPSSNRTLLKRIEEERDDALQELNAIKTERDSLRERLKVSSDSAAVDRRLLKQKADVTAKTLSDMEKENSNLRSQLSSTSEMISHLEEQVKNSTMSLTVAREELLEQKNQSSKCRLLLDQAERSLEDCQNKLSSKISELQAAEKKIYRLEDKIGDTKKQSSSYKDEVKRLRNVISSLDRERDSSQAEVDKRAEIIEKMQTEKKQKIQEAKQLESNLEDVESHLSLANEQIARKDREIQNLRKQLNNVGDEVSRSNLDYDQVHKENRRLHEDLAIMTEENQTLHEDLEKISIECTELKLQVQDYARQASRVQELLEIKDQEKAELLEQYRILNTEKEQMDSTARQTISETANMRARMAVKEEEFNQVREVSEQQEKEIEQHRLAQQSYEMQLSSMAQSLSNMEEQLRLAQEEKEMLLKDLSALRDLYLKLEEKNEDLSRRMTSQSMNNENLQAMFDAKKHEVEALRHQVFTERSSSRNLEQLLASKREKEYHWHKSQDDVEEDESYLKSDIKTMKTLSTYNSALLSLTIEDSRHSKASFEMEDSDKPSFVDQYRGSFSVTRDIDDDLDVEAQFSETSVKDRNIRVISPLD